MDQHGGHSQQRAEQPQDPGLERLAWSVLALTLGVILWGAYVRASGSGAGCGEHWPLCNGTVVPRAPSTKTLVELTHRITSGLSLLGAVWLYVRARKRLPVGDATRRGAGWTLVFFVIEALVGAALVKFRLVEGDTSTARAVVIGLHLINTFLLLAVLTWTALWSGRSDAIARRPVPARLRAMLGVGLAAMLLLGASGGVTALGDTLFPARSLAEGVAQDFSPTAHFLIRLRVWHPVFAVGAGLYWAALALALMLQTPRPGLRRAAQATIVLFAAQIAGGLLNLYLLAPTWMQMVHLALADALWIAVVWLCVEALWSPSPLALRGLADTPAPLPA